MKEITATEMHPYKWFRKFPASQVCCISVCASHEFMEEHSKGNHKKEKVEYSHKRVVWAGVRGEWQWLEDGNYTFQECFESCKQNPLWSLGNMQTAQRNT